MSDLDARLLAQLQPSAPVRGAAKAPTAIGTVLDVDPAAAEALVSVHDSSGSWVPATAARYRPGGVARVLLDPWSGGRATLVMPVDVYPPVVLGTITAINTSTGKATVDVLGRTGVVIPYIQGAYTVGARAWVLLDDWGTPVRVDGHSSEPSPTAPAVAPEPAQSTATVQVTVPISPQWSSTWRQERGKWTDQGIVWNTGRYGGTSTLYQGESGRYGDSGPLTGLATYGDQLVNLAAISIDRVQVMLRGAGLSGAAGPATVQGSPHASRPAGAPVSSGPTATGDGWVDLDAVTREGMRTGAVKALALVGGNYWAVLGAGNGDGMALAVTATIPT